jgi:membrane protease YdiL (CAAX protease family)
MDVEQRVTRAEGRLHPLWVALLVTLGAAALGLLPETIAGTAIGLWFLGATYWLVLRSRAPGVEREYGLQLGGLLELEPIDGRRLVKDCARALGWALGIAALAFPCFWLGYVNWYGTTRAFDPTVSAGELLDQLAAQVAVVALPEEAFYRGYLQTALDKIWRPRFSVFGAKLGVGLVIASAVFAVGHVLTEPYLGRLAVFFPSLLFGWLRARTGGIGAGVAFHAACNGFAWYLGRGYGLLGDP